MSEERIERQLAAILAADVAGYSRLMGEDEEGTLAALKEIRRELGSPKIAEYRGRIVKTTGDGFLVEFPSVVDAVRCAVEVQRVMAERNVEVPANKRIELRIGIHQGDIVVEDGDIFGDGVNIAARLEGLADPGGICVSARVQEDAAGKLDLVFRDLGEQQLKNITRLVRVYQVRDRRSPTEEPLLTSSQPLPRPDKPSIAVLPFSNLSGDPEQEYFTDAMVEDITANLSRSSGLFVIARGTAFTYKGQPVDAKQVGRELGVRYVLEGSVRKLGPHIRVNAQLIDTENATHLWADRFDHDAEDRFAVQDEIARRISIALSVELWIAEADRPTEHPDAMDYAVRGRAVIFGGPTSRERWTQGIALFEHALALDPRSALFQGYLASTLAHRVIENMTDTTAADLVRAESLTTQALAAAPRSSGAHGAYGDVLRAKRRYAEAIPEYETAFSFNPNAVWHLHSLACCKFFIGSIEESISLEEQAIRLSPRDPFIAVWYRQIGLVHLVQSRTNEAVVWLEKARNANRVQCHIRAQLASAYALAGQMVPAASELAEARRLSSDDRYSSLARLQAVENYEGLVPKVRGLLQATYHAGLRKAGMPEE
jgi:adenylate cyclase